MKYREAEEGHQINIGDVIVNENSFGKTSYTVERTTKCFAFVRYNEVAEGKFPREYRSFGFRSLPRKMWSTSRYRVLVPHGEEA